MMLWRRIARDARRAVGGAALLVAVGALAQVAPAETAQTGEAAEPAAAPGAVIERLHAALLGTMRSATELGFTGRRTRLGPVLGQTFDFAFMAEKSVGRSWQDLDPAQRERLVDAFEKLAVATYAARFSGWDGERFETLGQEAATHGTILVRTRIVQGDGAVVPLDYRLRPAGDGRWKIVDVFLNGTVSELALRRAEYSSVIRRDGFDGLVRALAGKIAEQERDAGHS